MTTEQKLLRAFRNVRPRWENSVEWDDDDVNLERIRDRADFLADAVEETGNFDDIAMVDINDAAVTYVTKD